MPRLLGIYPRNEKKIMHKTICAWILIAALLVITPNRKQSKCLSPGEWINGRGVFISGILPSNRRYQQPRRAKHGLILKTYSVKEAFHKGVHTVGFYLYEIVKQTKLIYESRNQKVIASYWVD